MKLIQVAFILFLSGFSTEGSENNFELTQDIVKKLLQRIVTLEDKVHNLEKEQEQKDETIADLSFKLEGVIKELRQQSESGTTVDVSDPALEERVEKLEQLSKFKTLRSCAELKARGLTLSGLYDIDPDGEGIGYEPIRVFCDFESGSTQIFHDKEDTIKVEKCSEIGCAVYEINYLAPPQQVAALMSLSETCYQDLNFGCFMAALRFDDSDHGFWTDKNGDAQASPVYLWRRSELLGQYSGL